MGEPSVIRSADLAARLGVDRSTLMNWYAQDARLAGCILRRTKHSTYWSVQLLRDRGFLTKPATTSAPQAQAVAG